MSQVLNPPTCSVEEMDQVECRKEKIRLNTRERADHAPADGSTISVADPDDF
jgi:hypothetical protein